MNAYSKHQPSRQILRSNHDCEQGRRRLLPRECSYAQAPTANRGFFPATVLPSRMRTQTLCGNTAVKLIDSHVFLLSLTLSHTHTRSLTHARALHMALKKCIFCLVTRLHGVGYYYYYYYEARVGTGIQRPPREYYRIQSFCISLEWIFQRIIEIPCIFNLNIIYCNNK